MSDDTKFWLRAIVVIFWLAILVLPAAVFFQVRGGFAFLSGTNFQTTAQLLFPLVGLYALTLVWTQFLLGSSATLWRSLFPSITKIHRRFGIFVFLVTLLHPSLIVIAYGEKYLGYRFLPTNLVIYAWAGTIALFLLTLTVMAGLLSRVSWMRKYWRAIHILNYLVFALVWYHSWNIGSDIQTTNLKWLWVFYLLTAVISASWRIRRVLVGRKPVSSAN